MQPDLKTKLNRDNEADDFYEDLRKAENSSANSPSHDPQDQSNESDSKDASTQVQDQESSSQQNPGWRVNVDSGGKDSSGKGGGRGKSVLKFAKKSSPLTAIIALIFGVGAIPFIGAATLPFAIVGNLNSNSMLHGLEKYYEDHLGVKIFGGKIKSAGAKSGNLRGLSAKEITQLEKKGIKFGEPAGTSPTGKKHFKSIEFKGKTIRSGVELKSAMRASPELRGALLFNKSSMWRSMTNSFGRSVKSMFRFRSTPPKLSSADAAKSRQTLTDTALGNEARTVTSAAKSIGEGEQTDPTDSNNKIEVSEEKANANEANKTKAREAIGAVSDDIDKIKADTAKGIYRQPSRAIGGDIASAVSRSNYELDSTKSFGGKAWGWVNSLDIPDTLCTMYNVAYTANILARSVMIFNIVRFGMTVRSTIEKAMAGDDDGSMEYLMALLQRTDPETGQSFDQSSYAAFLFNGQLSSEPSHASAYGGNAMLALYLSMRSIHGVAGEIFGGGAARGRTVLRNSCAVAQNVGVQVGIFAATFGIGSLIGKGASTTTKAAINSTIKKTTNDVSKSFAKRMADNIAGHFSGGVFRTVAKDAWGVTKVLWRGTTTWAKVGILFAFVGTFGMDYIVSTLAGENVDQLQGSSPAMMDSIGLAQNEYELPVALANGGNMSTVPNAMAYQPTMEQYKSQYIADRQYQASDQPLNIKDPYSMLGSAIFSVQKTIGISNSLSLPGTFLGLASLPFKTLASIPVNAADDPTKPTPENIAKQYQFDGLSNPTYASEENIALTVTGTPQVVIQKYFDFDDILDKLVDGSNPQIEYLGDDPTTDEPILRIIEGSSLYNYADACHNPNKTEIDPEFWYTGDSDGGKDGKDPYTQDENFNGYNIKKCVAGKEIYDRFAERNRLYDDAIRFIGQISASEYEVISYREPTTPIADYESILADLSEVFDSLSNNLPNPESLSFNNQPALSHLGYVSPSATPTSKFSSDRPILNGYSVIL